MEEAEECEVNFYNNDEEKFKGRGGHNQGVQEEPVTPPASRETLHWIKQ